MLFLSVPGPEPTGHFPSLHYVVGDLHTTIVQWFLPGDRGAAGTQVGDDRAAGGRWFA